VVSQAHYPDVVGSLNLLCFTNPSNNHAAHSFNEPSLIHQSHTCSGTDSGPIIHGTALGAAVHLELFLYVSRCDFSPTEALSSATAVTARRFGLLDRGRAQAGLRADLVLVRGNPTKEIGDAINVIKVWKEGILVKDLSGH